MITLNTNLGSLIVQSNLKTSTNGLNTAIERMTSGFKINYAKDNAANYSINTKLSSKLSSYYVAQDNASMGLDMLTTAMDSLELILSHLLRMHDLAEQAANGTYGESSLKAIQSEIDARTNEITRVVSNTEYNKINLFEGEIENTGGKFINEVVSLTEDEALAQGYTVIKTADELQAMQDNLSGKYILMNDIDLSGYAWNVIGDSTNPFAGEFNGNGYAIKNLTINKPTEDYQGLFGYVNHNNVKFMNIGLENVNITGKVNVGALLAKDATNNSVISNCYVSGIVNGECNVGGLLGDVEFSAITDCYSSCSVTGLGGSGDTCVGGLVGQSYQTKVINCYATGDVNGFSIISAQTSAGGLVGDDYKGYYLNCYAKGNVTSDQGRCLGGLIGKTEGAELIKCFAAGNVADPKGRAVGGLIGGNMLITTLTNCYATGDVFGSQFVGGLVGYSSYPYLNTSNPKVFIIKNCFATGDVSCPDSGWCGGLAGFLSDASEINNSYASGKVNEGGIGGGLVGCADVDVSITNSYYDIEKSGHSIGIGEDRTPADAASGGVAGKITVQLDELISSGVLYSPAEEELIYNATNFQVGIDSSENSNISLNISFALTIPNVNVSTSESARNALNKIDELIKRVNTKQTEYGSAYNRLESALETIGVSIENLTSTQSTIRDADIAEESSNYIRYQILQQASATLLASSRNLKAQNVIGLLNSVNKT